MLIRGTVASHRVVWDAALACHQWLVQDKSYWTLASRRRDLEPPLLASLGVSGVVGLFQMHLCTLAPRVFWASLKSTYLWCEKSASIWNISAKLFIARGEAVFRGLAYTWSEMYGSPVSILAGSSLSPFRSCLLGVQQLSWNHVTHCGRQGVVTLH